MIECMCACDWRSGVDGDMIPYGWKMGSTSLDSLRIDRVSILMHSIGLYTHNYR